MTGYIFIELDTSENAMMGAAGWNGYSEKDSIAAFDRAVLQAVCAAFPGVEIETQTYAMRRVVTTDMEGAADAVNDIIDRVWQSWEWLTP